MTRYQSPAPTAFRAAVAASLRGSEAEHQLQSLRFKVAAVVDPVDQVQFKSRLISLEAALRKAVGAPAQHDSQGRHYSHVLQALRDLEADVDIVTRIETGTKVPLASPTSPLSPISPLATDTAAFLTALKAPLHTSHMMGPGSAAHRLLGANPGRASATCISSFSSSCSSSASSCATESTSTHRRSWC